MASDQAVTHEDLPTIFEASTENNAVGDYISTRVNGRIGAGISGNTDPSCQNQIDIVEIMSQEYETSNDYLDSSEAIYDDALLSEGLQSSEDGTLNGDRRGSSVKELVDSLEESDTFKRGDHRYSSVSSTGSATYGTVAFSTSGYSRHHSAGGGENGDEDDVYADPIMNTDTKHFYKQQKFAREAGPSQFMSQLQSAIQKRQGNAHEVYNAPIQSVYSLESGVGPVYEKEQRLQPDQETENCISYYGSVTDNRFNDSSEVNSTYVVYDDSRRRGMASPSNQCYGNEEEGIYFDPAGLQRSGDNYDPILEYHDSESDPDVTWGSTEFDSFSDEAEDDPGITEESTEPRSGSTSSSSGMFSRIKQTIRQIRDEPESDNEEMYIEFRFNEKKHPPPSLGPIPEGLTTEQTKRRYIVGCIVDSENSYVNTLQRLVKEYQVPLLEANPAIISRAKIRTIFYKVKQILQCHSMFQIALAARVSKWDTDEKIGDCFTASFAKSMVLDVYSDFVNNFSVAMDLAKYCAKQKPGFNEFMKECQAKSPDKLSLFGLMVKPVQRFPQFILLLQDLLKHTSKDHHDRLDLQLALTELENLAHKLNDRKRDSEQRHAAKQVFNNLNVKLVQKTSDGDPHLIREDDVIESVYNNNGTMVKAKSRRLIMLNDTLLCAGVHIRETDMGKFEKYHLKLSVPIRNVLVTDTVITPDTKVALKGDPGRITICSARPQKHLYKKKNERETAGCDDLYKELDNLLHDFTVITQISSLVSSLKCSYEKLNEVMLQEMSRGVQVEIQKLDEHLKTIDSSALQLVFKAKSGHKEKVHIQMSSPEVKQSWLSDLRTAQLAASPVNNPGWMEKDSRVKRVNTQLPLFMDPLHVNITQQMDKVTCSAAFLLPSHRDDGPARQFLWLCGGTDTSSSVTVVSLRTDQVHVMESFTACDSQVLCTELVPGCLEAEDSSYKQDTMWMGTSTGRIFVHGIQDGKRQDLLVAFSARSSVLCLCYANDRVFAGLQSGELTVYSRGEDGSWKFSEPVFIPLASYPVSSILAVDFSIWCACGKTICILDCDTLQTEDTLKLSFSMDAKVKFMVRAGVGLFVSYSKMAVIQLYHMETFDHLQDINVGSTVKRFRSEPQDESEPKMSISPPDEPEAENIEITAMVGSRSWLWIGTSAGRILTIPLPRLEGVPLTTGRPHVAYHGHMGPVNFLVATVKPLMSSKPLVFKSSTVGNKLATISVERRSLPKEGTNVTSDRNKRSDFAKSGGAKSKKSTSKCSESKSSKWISGLSFRRSSFGRQRMKRHSSSKEEELTTAQKSRSLGSLTDIIDEVENADDINTLYSALMAPQNSDYDAMMDGDPYSRLCSSDSLAEDPFYMTFQPNEEDFMRYQKNMIAKARNRSKLKNATGRLSFSLPPDVKTGSQYDLKPRPKSEAIYHSYNPTAGDNDEEPEYIDFVAQKSTEEDGSSDNSGCFDSSSGEHLAPGSKSTSRMEGRAEVKRAKLSLVGNSFLVISGGKGYKCHNPAIGGTTVRNSQEPALLMWQCAL